MAEKELETTQPQPETTKPAAIDSSEIQDAELEEISAGDEADALFGKRNRM